MRYRVVVEGKFFEVFYVEAKGPEDACRKYTDEDEASPESVTIKTGVSAVEAPEPPAPPKAPKKRAPRKKASPAAPTDGEKSSSD